VSIHPLVHRIGDIALQACSRAEFRINTLLRLSKEVGAEGGAICSDVLVAPDLCDGHHVIDGSSLENRFVRSYLGDFAPDCPQLLRATAWRDRDVFSARTRDRAALYREYLPRIGLRSFVARCWADASGFHLITLASRRGVDGSRFFRRAAAAIDAVFPIVALAERVHGPGGTPRPSANVVEEWARGHGVAPAEFKVISLVERGLTNTEVATALSISANTVRNHLASAFRKLNVSTRAELAYHLGVAREARVDGRQPARHGRVFQDGSAAAERSRE
jgi:DNA-binding CsgD family transcriptional regulator